MINGNRRGRFEASQGLRQGDPLSPFSFTLVVDVLGRLMDKAVDVGVVEGVKIGREEVCVSHLHADDTLFLLEANNENLRNLNCILKFFTGCSGLKINMGKSAIAGTNVGGAMVGDLALEWRCEWPLKYLGQLMPIYHMSIFKLPGFVVEISEKMMRSFLWDKDDGGKVKSLVGWGAIVKSKRKGGLGLGNLKGKKESFTG